MHSPSRFFLLLLALGSAIAYAGDLVSISDSSRCDRVPSENRDSCRAAIRRGNTYDFLILESSANRLAIQPVDRQKLDAPTLADNGKPFHGLSRIEPADRQANALESIAESSKQTANAVTVIAALDAALAVLAVILLAK